ncbi:MAG: hypothetical protein ABI584_15700, partial [Acidobacteriota bacterium]
AAAFAVIVAVVRLPTPTVRAVNVELVAPPVTVTFGGSMAAPLSLVRFTTKPEGGAGLESVTVPVNDVPPFNTVGLSEKLERTGGLIVSVAVFVTAAAFAVIVAVVRLPTPTVRIVNVVVVAPLATAT